MEHLIKTLQTPGKKMTFGAVLKITTKLCYGLLEEYIVAKEADAQALQAVTIYSMQEPVFKKGLPLVINHMFNEDLLEAEAIVNWYNKDPSGPIRSCYKENIPTLIKHMEESSEEDSD